MVTPFNFDNHCPGESVGIDSQWLINFLNRIEKQDLCIHSAIIMRHNHICLEAYYEPYTRDTLHRMFSITKSFTGLAIGILIDDGRLRLDDHIVDFFPEKQPAEGPYEYTAMVTIKDMLEMRTCHNSTTYKLTDDKDWVGSFFTVKPTHIPGTNFSYDTSSSHVLAALVEKITGMNLLDFLRERCLDEIGFSKDAHILPDPSGSSLGGSGLCATPLDILKVIMLIANDGRWNNKQLLPESYIKSARTLHADPYGKQGTLEELQGYGYQMWCTRNGGYALYGMGGQLALYVPDKDIYMVTTADTQVRAGGVQLLYDAFWDEIYNRIETDTLAPNPEAQQRLLDTVNSRKLFVMPGANLSPNTDKINGTTYTFCDNVCGVSDVSLHFDKDDNTKGGYLQYTNESGTHRIDFGIGANKQGTFPDYNMKYAASASWRTDDYFLIRVQIIDTAIGNIYIGLNYKDDYITVMFRKTEETLFEEYNGVFSGKKSIV